MRKSKKTTSDEFVTVGGYLIPSAQADMYRVLKEVVTQEITEILVQHEFEVVLEVDEEGIETLCGKQQDKADIYIELSPTTISNAQRARDKDQLDKYVATFM